MIALFALASTVIILAVGLTIDGGYAFAQRRGSQNASDFAALAGARVVAEWVGGDTTNGIDANVQTAITNSIAGERRHTDHVRVAEWPHLHHDERYPERICRFHGGRQDPGRDGWRERVLEQELDAVLPRHHRRQQLDGQLHGDRQGRLLARWTTRRRVPRGCLAGDLSELADLLR